MEKGESHSVLNQLVQKQQYCSFKMRGKKILAYACSSGQKMTTTISEPDRISEDFVKNSLDHSLILDQT